MNRRSFVGLLGAALAGPAAAMGLSRKRREPKSVADGFEAVGQICEGDMVALRDDGRVQSLPRTYVVPKGHTVTNWGDPSQWLPRGIPGDGDTVVVYGAIDARPSRMVTLREFHVGENARISGLGDDFLVMTARGREVRI